MSQPSRRLIAAAATFPLALAGITLSAADVAAAGPLPCGTVITQSTVLTADMVCDGSTDALRIGADNIVLDLGGHTISGPGAYAGTGSGVRIAGHSGVTVQKGMITGVQSGVVIDSGSNNTVTKVVSAANDRGVDLANAPGTTVSKSTIRDNGRDGVRIGGFGSSAVTVTQNVLSGNTWGINVSDAPSAKVTRNVVTASRVGIAVSDHSVGATIAQNDVSASTGNGIETAPTTSGTLVSRNTSWNNGGYGFAISGAAGTVTIVEKNTATGNIAGGFLLVGNVIDNGGNTVG